jgi:hypothetical protein
LDQLRPGDTLVVWKLDRLGRALWQLVDTVTSLAERGIGFRSLPEAVDTTTPLASSSSSVRRLGRVRARPHPRAHRRRAGRRSGPWPPRRPTVSADRSQAAVAQELYQSGQCTVAAIAMILGCQPRLDCRHLTPAGIRPESRGS